MQKRGKNQIKKKNKILFKDWQDFKEGIANFFKNRVDISSNIARNYQLILKNQKYLKEIEKNRLSPEKSRKIFFYSFIARYLNKVKAKKKKKNLKSIFIYLRIIKYLFKLKKQIYENKFVHSFRTYTSKRLRRFLKLDVETNKIKFNPYLKFPLPGYPHLIAQKRKRLKKKLLVCRLRNKSKFLILQQSIALHSFIGTKDLSYSGLVKNNKLHFLSILYQYKFKKKKKERLSYKERKFLKRPFKLIRMNQARFHIMDIPSYSLWYEKMKEQMIHNDQCQI